MKTRKRHSKYRFRGGGKNKLNGISLAFDSFELSNNEPNLGDPLSPKEKRPLEKVFVAKDSVFDTDKIKTGGITSFLKECRYIKKDLAKGSFATSHLILHGLEILLLRVVVSSSIKDIENEIDIYTHIAGNAGHTTYVSRLLYADIPRTIEPTKICYFLFHYQSGRSLKEVFEAGETSSLEKAVGVVDGLINCITFLHTNGILHRDVKPANFFLPEGMTQPLVFDFGTSCFEPHDCTTYEFTGTREYAHPSALETFRTIGTPYTFKTDDDMYAIQLIATKDIAPCLSVIDRTSFLKWVAERFSKAFTE